MKDGMTESQLPACGNALFSTNALEWASGAKGITRLKMNSSMQQLREIDGLERQWPPLRPSQDDLQPRQ